MPRRYTTRQLTLAAMLAALALTAHALETALPPPWPAVPGFRLGLANLFVLLALFGLDTPAGLAVLAIKSLLGPLLGGMPTGILYSLCGSVLAMPAMLAAKRLGFGLPGASLCGAVGNQIGQVLCAVWLYHTPGLLWQLPGLLAFGGIAGFCIGLLAALTLKRLRF